MLRSYFSNLNCLSPHRFPHRLSAVALFIVTVSLGGTHGAQAGKCLAVGSNICVIDGDTFAIGSEKIRMANIDAPEIGNPQCDAERRLGLVARKRLAMLLESGRVEIRRGDPKSGRSLDRYGRTLATAYVEGVDVGSIMIEEELARPWRGRREPWCIK